MNGQVSGPSDDTHLTTSTLYGILVIYAALVVLAFCNASNLCSPPSYTETFTTCRLGVEDCRSRMLADFNQAAPKKPLVEWWASVQTEQDGLRNFDRVFNCPICLEVVSKSQLIHTLPCRHVFHDHCLQGWILVGHNSCPLCLRPLLQIHYMV